MKINKRLINIAIVSFILALVFTFLAYNSIKKAVEPERKEKIAYFKYNIEKGNKIKEGDLYLKDTPVSLIPNNSVKNPKEYIDKTLVIDATPNDFALSTDFISRGETRVDVNDMYQLGVKVDSIDNFLGTQLKDGDYYGLLYIDKEGNSERIYKVKLINMIDSTGKIVIDSGDSVVAGVNIAVNDLNDMRAIAERKRLGTFELIKVPESQWDTINKQDTTDQENTTKSDMNNKENNQ